MLDKYRPSIDKRQFAIKRRLMSEMLGATVDAGTSSSIATIHSENTGWTAAAPTVAAPREKRHLFSLQCTSLISLGSPSPFARYGANCGRPVLPRRSNDCRPKPEVFIR